MIHHCFFPDLLNIFSFSQQYKIVRFSSFQEFGGNAIFFVKATF